MAVTHQLDEMFALASALGNQSLPSGRRVAIITNAGGPAILCADACEASGLVVSELSDQTKERLRSFLPAAASYGNPVDLIASAGPEHYRQAVEVLVATKEVDAVIVIYIPVDASGMRGIAQAISHRLVREHRILELRGDERGFFLIPYEALFKIDSLFDEIAVWTRKIIITGIAVIWLISPIDLFPDSVPVLGAIDDALIALVGAGQWVGTIKRKKLP